MSTTQTIDIDQNQIKTDTFPVTGMSCAACASSVETILTHTDGVEEASVNFASNSVLIKYNSEITPEGLSDALSVVGYGLIIEKENAEEKQEELKEQHYQEIKKRTIYSAILTAPVFIIGMFFMDWAPGKWISLALTIPILFYLGKDFYVNAWRLAKHRTANMDTLVALSTGIAFLFSLFNTFFPDFWLNHGITPHVYYEAAAVIITFISLGKMLEEKAKASTSSAIKKLMGLQPKTLTVIVDGSEQQLDFSKVKIGDTVVVRPGEKVPVDGVVSEGHTYIDESMITGEPVPILKKIDSKVFAGTINQKGSFQFRTEKVGSDTLLAQIIKLVKEAQSSKAPVQKLVDKIAAVFVPTVIGISILTFVIWMIFGGDEAFTHALLTSVAVLVIACPCALGLATPTAIMVGVGKGAENNILIKDAESLELGYKVNAVVLDKTGTITQGKPTVSEIHWQEGVDRERLSSILLSAELKSEHPLGAAVVSFLKSADVQLAQITNFESITGRGVSAEVEGQNYYIGNLDFVAENNVLITDEMKQAARTWQKQGSTVIFFADDENVLAVISILDKLKATSAEAIHQLQRKGVDVYMLTGDHEETAEAVASQLELTGFRAGVLPSDKADFVKELQSKNKIVAMIGDGINDSQALAQADVSMAMGHGTDVAMDVAKMTLMTSDLAYIPKALNLSKLTVNGIRQNLFWAFIYNVIGIPLAAGALFPVNGFLLDPMIAGAAMAFSSVSVVSNSLRLKLKKL